MEVGVKQILGKSFQKCVPKKLDPPQLCRSCWMFRAWKNSTTHAHPDVGIKYLLKRNNLVLWDQFTQYQL